MIGCDAPINDKKMDRLQDRGKQSQPQPAAGGAAAAAAAVPILNFLLSHLRGMGPRGVMRSLPS